MTFLERSFEEFLCTWYEQAENEFATLTQDSAGKTVENFRMLRSLFEFIESVGFDKYFKE